MNPSEASSVSRKQENKPVIRHRINSLISPSADGDELFCERSVEIRELTDPQGPQSNDDGIRVYGSHQCAVIQLRGVSALTRGGKPRRLIATASYISRKEIRALITKLSEIEPTLPE